MSSGPPPSTIGFEPHDHQACRENALKEVRALCAARKLRLTPVRQRTLELLWDAHRPFGAYELMEKLGEEGFGAHPPTVYRALDFLVVQGFAHRLNTTNAFVGCPHPHEPHTPHFMICSECQEIREFFAPKMRSALEDAMREESFDMRSAAIEVTGVCQQCRLSAA